MIIRFTNSRQLLAAMPHLAGTAAMPATNIPREPTILWCCVSDVVDAAFLDSLPHLQYIVCPSTGLDHIDTAEAQRRGIRVLSLRDCWEKVQDVSATAELTIGLMLALLRNIPAANRQPSTERYRFTGRSLDDKTVLVVGSGGRVGIQVRRMLDAFDACVDFGEPCDYPLRLEMADIVTIHADLNDTSRGMVNAAWFSRMKPGAYLVNTARGEIVDEAALFDALKSGHLAGAALDVHSQEPGPFPEPLLAFAERHPERLILTPHIGGCTVEAIEQTTKAMAETLVEVIEHDKR